MIKQTTIFYIILLLNVSIAHSQDSLECQTKLSYFHEPVKAKKYDKAYEPWLFVYNKCPDLNRAIYAHGEKILKHKIKTANDKEKPDFIQTLLDLWKKRQQYFASSTPKGEYDSKACQLLYEHREVVGESKVDLYSCFDKAFTEDKRTFRNPKSLYTYFSLAVDLFDLNKKTASELFNTYDEINEKIEAEIQNYSEKLNVFISKIEKGETLTTREEGKKNAYESYLKAYALIQKNIDAKIGIRADCEKLIPLYAKGYQNNQNDSIWLKRAVSRLHHKECTDDDFYEELVKQYDRVAPSADTKYYIAMLLFKKGKDKEAHEYLVASSKLETRSYKKSKIVFKIGVAFKNKNQYSKSRKYLLEALKLNPSNGKSHLIIADMYSESAKNKNCGEDNFYQRAVYWLAAKEAEKAARVDPNLQGLVNLSVTNYLAKAPTKEEIFLKGLSGKTIEIKCWINRSVVVPEP